MSREHSVQDNTDSTDWATERSGRAEKKGKNWESSILSKPIFFWKFFICSPQKLYKKTQRSVFRYSAHTASLQRYNVTYLLKYGQTLVPVSRVGGLVVYTHSSCMHCFSLHGNQGTEEDLVPQGLAPRWSQDVVKASHHRGSRPRPSKRNLGYCTISYNTISYIILQ